MTARTGTRDDPAHATIDPDADADVCDGHDCTVREGLVTVDPDDPNHDRRTVCSVHLVTYLEDLR